MTLRSQVPPDETPEAWASILEDPAFWANYLPDSHPAIGSISDFENAHEAALQRFGISEERRQGMEAALFGTQIWSGLDTASASPELQAEVDALLGDLAMGPEGESLRQEILQKRVAEDLSPAPLSIALPFEGGWTWTITFARPGIYHALVHADLPARLALGHDDPHFHLPILRRQEAEQLAAALASGSGVLSRYGRLLLSTTVWSARDEDPRVFEAFLAGALRNSGVFDEQSTSALVAAWMPMTLLWRPSRELGFINDGRYSHRNPENGDWSAEDFGVFGAFLSAALAPLDSPSLS